MLPLLLPPDGAKQRRGPWGSGSHGLAVLGAWRRPGIGGKGQGNDEIRFPSSISEEGARREGCDGHGLGGQAVAVGGVAGAARGEHR